MAERRHNLAWSLRPLARSSVGREGCRGHTWGTPEPIGKIGLPPASGRRTVHTVPGPGRSLAGRTPRWLGGRTAPLDLRRPLRYGNCTHSAEGVLDGEETIPHSVPNTQFLIPTISLLCQVVSVRAPAATDGSPPRVRVASLIPRQSRSPKRIRRIRSRSICAVDLRRSVPFETQSARPPSRY